MFIFVSLFLILCGVLHLDRNIGRNIDEDNETVLHETNDYGNPNSPEKLEEKTFIIEKIKQLEIDMKGLSEKQLWVMRLKLLFYDPLTKDEYEGLMRYTGKSEDVLSKEIEKLKEYLIDLSFQKESDFSSSVRILSVLNALESRLNGYRNNPDIPDSQVKELEERILKRRARREELMNSANQIIDATNRHVAEILGIEENNVSVELHRARKKLIKDGK